MPLELPPGWSEQQVRALLAHYESQTEEEAAAEDEAAFLSGDICMVEVPIDLLRAVRKLLGKR